MESLFVLFGAFLFLIHIKRKGSSIRALCFITHINFHVLGYVNVLFPLIWYLHSNRVGEETRLRKMLYYV